MLLIDKDGRITSPTDAQLRNPKTALSAVKRSGGFVWIGLEDPDADELAPFVELLGLHPLAVKDALTGKQQPKIQVYPGHLFVVLWALSEQSRSRTSSVGEVFLFLSDNLLLSVQRDFGKHPLNIPEIFEGQETVLREGALGAMYGVMTHIANTYSNQASDIEEELEKLEQQVFDQSKPENSERLYRLRLHIGKLKRAVSSIEAAWKKSEDHLSGLTIDHANLAPYVNDLLDDLSGTSQLIADQGAAIEGLLSSHENNVASQQNVDTRKISAIAALLSVPAVLAGLAGMNFKNLPGITWQYGWEALVLIILAIDAAMYMAFRRRGWL